jgi:hypothetical protein
MQKVEEELAMEVQDKKKGIFKRHVAILQTKL